MKNKFKNIPALMYNVKRLNEDISIIDAIAFYTGENVSTKGGKNISCPAPDHKDKFPSAHIYGNICKCFSCGQKFNPVSLARAYNPDLSFPDLCRKIISDFNLNAYEYSNLSEVEAALNAKTSNKFYDCFPASNQELELIGIKDASSVEKTYAIKATEYYKETCGEIPPFADVYDSNGKEVLVECTRREAYELGLIEATDEEMQNGLIEEHEYFNLPSIKDLWKENKSGIEEMVIGKCYETLENESSRLENFRKAIQEYKENNSEQDIAETDSLRKEYCTAFAEGKYVVLTEQQFEKIQGLNNFEFLQKNLSESENKIDSIEKVLDKVFKQQEERAKAKALEKKKLWGIEK